GRDPATRHRRRQRARGRRDWPARLHRTAGGRAGAVVGGGAAARDTYPGEVIRRLRATPQARVRGRGEVTVSFTITPAGAVAGVVVQRGSGQPALDAAALDHIRRAAPFPPPPPGAQTRFTLPVSFR
ncbi:TonB family protein, partial [Rhodobaculum claviforme]